MRGPHIPMTSVAGHFMGMQPQPVGASHSDEVWYRGDDYMALVAECDKYKRACMGVLEIIDGPTPLSGDDMIFEILDIVQKALE